MLQFEMTYHAKNDRITRFEFILQTVGAGKKEIATEIFISPTSQNRKAKSVLMDNGVIYIFSIENNKLITAYIASISQAVALYKKCHKCNKCPQTLMNVLYKNQQYITKQPK